MQPASTRYLDQAMERRSVTVWPQYDEEQIAAVADVLRSGQVNAWTGPYVENFERAYAQYLGRNYAIALANGSVALDLALHAIDLQPGDQVIVTPRSFIASVSCVPLANGVPVFADVDLQSQNLTAATIESNITPRTRAIIVVHLGGWPCDMDPIMELARRHRLWVIEDCSQAHGAEYKGRPVGTFGHIATFSFCQDKIISTGGEGGLIAMDEEALWSRAWSHKDHGKSFDAVTKTVNAFSFRWLHESFGTNLRMSAMQAVLGCIQLDRLSAWNAQRLANARVLAKAATSCAALRTPVPPFDIKHAWYRFYTFVRPERLKHDWDRDRIMAEINRRGVKCLAGSCSEIYLEKAFVGSGYEPTERLPNARVLGETSLAFLVDPAQEGDAIAAAAKTLKEVVSEASLGSRDEM